MEQLITITGEQRKLLNGIVVQDVNYNRISSHLIAGILEQLGIEYKRINVSVVAVDLVGNIEPHDDISYCNGEGYRKAVFVVTHCASGRGKYNDSCAKNYMYSNNGFRWLMNGYAFPFNPKKEHAVMVNGRIKGFVIFY